MKCEELTSGLSLNDIRDNKWVINHFCYFSMTSTLLLQLLE